MLERGGELRTMVTPSLRKGDVQGAVRANVKKGAGLYTDELPAFNGLRDDYVHLRVNHSAGKYVRSFIIHTNGIEGVWVLFKRQIVGTHHYLSPKHISRYLSEMTWRFNAREMGEGERVNALIAQAAGRLTYKELTA